MVTAPGYLHETLLALTTPGGLIKGGGGVSCKGSLIPSNCGGRVECSTEGWGNPVGVLLVMWVCLKVEMLVLGGPKRAV